MAAIYCGTYAKYSSGSLFGKWIELDDLESEEEFWAICRELHSDEADAEFMFQDFEGFPRSMYSECGFNEAILDYVQYDDHHNGDVKAAFMEIWDEWDREKCEERFRGVFNSRADFAEDYLNESGFFEGVKPDLERYFDFDGYARDMEMNGDVSEHNGYYFWR